MLVCVVMAWINNYGDHQPFEYGKDGSYKLELDRGRIGLQHVILQAAPTASGAAISFRVRTFFSIPFWLVAGVMAVVVIASIYFLVKDIRQSAIRRAAVVGL
jgi:hypothetical protein